MPLPGVQINVADGALGRSVATDDGVAGLVLTGIAATGLALSVPKQIFSLSEAVELGITPATHPHAYNEIRKFYNKAFSGAELWILLTSEATTQENVFAASVGAMDTLLTASLGRITIAATSMGRAAGYTPTVTGSLDFAIGPVATAAQSLAAAYAAKFTPVNIIVDGTYFSDTNPVTSIKGAGDYVSVFVGAEEAGKRASTMGSLLGSLAAIPVHQSVARVKTGVFCAEGYLTSGLSIKRYNPALIGQLHDAGYMALRNYPGVFGTFVTDDLTLAAPTSDFTSLARRRVMNKAIRIAYSTYVYEINDTIEIGPDGKLLPTKVSYIEDVIKRALRTRMLAEGNCSAIDVTVNPDQNVLETDQIEIVVKITPLGYLKHIIVKLGFYNPANS